MPSVFIPLERSLYEGKRTPTTGDLPHAPKRESHLQNGLTVMLDKVLVTEDNIYISVLMGIAEKNGKNLVVPSDFQINGYDIDVSPVVPYPPDYFEIKLGGGGGGGPYINVLHEDPLVVYDGIGKNLMYSDGYVSVKDPMHVKVRILRVEVCWDEEIAPQRYTSACYTETESSRSEERRVGKECRSRWSPYH